MVCSRSRGNAQAFWDVGAPRHLSGCLSLLEATQIFFFFFPDNLETVVPNTQGSKNEVAKQVPWKGKEAGELG